MKQYVVCPCCGRSELAEKLLSNARKPIERGGQSWLLSVRRRIRPEGGSGGFTNTTEDAEMPEDVLSELVRRCRAFLKAHEEKG